MQLLYKLEDKVPRGKFLSYSLQHVIMFLSSGVAITVVIGIAFQLSMPEISAMMQRAFFVAGLFTAIQGAAGHRYPIVDGPAGLWASMLLLIAPTLRGHMTTVLTDLETGIMIGGALVVVVTALNLMPYIFKLFTPAVNGVLMMLMVLQISSSIIRGMTGLWAEGGYIDGASVVVFVFTIVVILVLNVRTKGFVKTIAALIGAGAGWLFAIPLGNAPTPENAGNYIFSLPKAFAFGPPTWNPGLVIVCIFSSFVVLSMVYASMTGMSEVVDRKIDDKGIKKGVMIHGLAATVAGILPVVPMIPYIAPIGLVVTTRVAARKPLVAGGLFMLLMGLVSPVGALFSAIPIPVGYAVMTVMFAVIFKQGLYEVQKDAVEFPDNIAYVVGIAMIIGIGMMFLPFEAFLHLPGVLPYLLSNGLIDGIVVAIVLDRLLLKRKDKKD